MKHLIFICIALAVGAMAVTAEDMEAPAATVKMQGEPMVKDFPAMKAATMMVKAADYVPEGGYPAGGEGTHMAYEKMFTNGYGALGKWMEEAGVHPAGPAFAVFYEDPTETEPAKLTSKLGFPVSGDVAAKDPIMVEELPAMPMVVTLTYEGPYEASMPAWEAVMKYIPANGYAYAGGPMEIYHKGPHETQNPAEYVTEIRWPVMKAEAEPKE